MFLIVFGCSTLLNTLSDLKDADVYVHTEYIDSQGQRLSDSHRVGNLCRSGISTKMVLIESAIYELQGRSILMSMKL